MKNNKKWLIAALLMLIIISIPFTLSLLKKPQDPRSRAQAIGSTKLFFEPVSSTSSPIKKNIGDTVPVDMIVDPGTDMVSFIKFQVSYDPTKLALDTSNPFTLNTASFPVKVEGPVVANSTLGESVSVGPDGTKMIQAKTKVGTVNFKAIGGTGNAVTTVSFTNITQALSGGSDVGNRTNVLSGTTPAYISIAGGTNVSPTTTGDPCQGDACPSTTPGPTGRGGTTISFDLLLHGVGAAGDNPNPSGNSLSNKTPLHPQRNLTVFIYNSSNQAVATSSGGINYDAQSGSFKGSIAFKNLVNEGDYSIKVVTPRYLRKQVPGAQRIKPLQDNRISQTSLVAGDTNGDNALDIRDYNALLNCGYGVIDPLPIDDANSLFNKPACKTYKPAENVDIDDNGIINSFDYNLFLRELSVQGGD